MSDNEPVKLYPSPAWRRALAELFDSGRFTYGATIDHDTITRAFGMTPLTGSSYSADEVERWTLQRLRNLDSLREHLLAERQMLLAPVNGQGYQVLKPEAQTTYALGMGRKKLNKAIRVMGEQLSNVNRSRLNDEQLRANADAVARLAFLNAAMKSARRALFFKK